MLLQFERIFLQLLRRGFLNVMLLIELKRLSQDLNKLNDHCCDSRRGGGTALLVKDSLQVKKVDAGEETSFEYFKWAVNCGCYKLKILIIYRIPHSAKHPMTTNTFLDVFTSYLESVITSSELLLPAGF